MRIIATTAIASIAFICGAFAQWGNDQNSPEKLRPATSLKCGFPTEDSCIPDYIGNGEWILKPQTP